MVSQPFCHPNDVLAFSNLKFFVLTCLFPFGPDKRLYFKFFYHWVYLFPFSLNIFIIISLILLCFKTKKHYIETAPEPRLKVSAIVNVSNLMD